LKAASATVSVGTSMSPDLTFSAAASLSSEACLEPSSFFESGLASSYLASSSGLAFVAAAPSGLASSAASSAGAA